jgi:hypothetical protein
MAKTRRRARIAAVGSNQANASALLAGVTPHTPMENPAFAVTYLPVAVYPWGQSGVLAYQDLHPLWTSDGGVIPAFDPGTWGSLYAAGRP